MNFAKRSLIVGMTVVLASCGAKTDNVTPTDTQSNQSMPSDFKRLRALERPAPVPTKVESTREYHGKTLSDPYFWMKDQDYPTINDEPVLDYLKEENAYYQEFLKPHTPLVDTIFEEFKGRTDETEKSVPYISNGYEYRWYYKEGAEYRTRARKNLETGEDSVFMDVPQLVKGSEYFVIGDWSISPDNRYLAYSYDTAGDERYQVKVRDLQTGEYLPDVLNDVSGSVSFSSDGGALVYALLEKDRWHAKNIKAHTLGTDQNADRTLYTEEDDGFFIGFGRTSSKEYFVIVSSQGEIQESYVIPADLSGELTQIVPRSAGFTQTIDHAHGDFYILANDTHSNSRLVKVSDDDPSIENWVTLREGSDENYLMNMQTFDDFMVVKSRKNGFETIEVLDYPEESSTALSGHSVEFDEEIFTASIGINPEFSQDKIRLNYESMVTPSTVYDYDLGAKTLETRKVQNIPSGYDKSKYATERLMIPARDGTLIPVSIVYKKGFKKDGSQPMWLYGYGAYSSTVTPRFSTLRLSALDRGFSYAIAHVRGGSMMGYDWYLDGKLTKRENTFNDFVDVANGLVERDYVAAGNISASGRSAGGELMGAVTIQSPELWRSVNLGVPFVDVLNTMLDASLPLTPPEWKEWGNPIEDPAAYDLLQSYSPYDNITARDYPPMFVSGGLNDPRVTYWEPAKWTAKMRELKTDDNLLVMRMNMGAGHFSNSGRYGRLRDYAEEYAFMLLAHGIEE